MFKEQVAQQKSGSILDNTYSVFKLSVLSSNFFYHQSSILELDQVLFAAYLLVSITHAYQFLCICRRVKMSLFDSFKDVYEKVFTTSSVNTDNLIFKLHYRVTVSALVIFSVVLSLGQVRFFYCPNHLPKKIFCLVHPQVLRTTMIPL